MQKALEMLAIAVSITMAESTPKSTMRVGGIEARNLSQNSHRC